VPSVVYGIWGFKFLVPITDRLSGWFTGGASSGTGILVAGVVLAVMILPYVTAISFDVCRAVPRSQREGALALGSTRWQTIWNVVLPYARSGIVGGCFLALARALGETMAVVMLVGQSTDFNPSPFAKGYTIASFIAVKLQDYSGLDRSAVMELGLVLLLVTIFVNCLARLLLWQVGRPGGVAGLVGWVFLPRRPAAPPPPAGPPPGDAGPAAAAEPHQPLRGSSPLAFAVDRVMPVVLAGCLAVTVLPLFTILLYIAYRGAGAVGWNFFTHPLLTENDADAGLGHAIVGTVMLVLLATLIAVPVGLLAGVFLVEYRASRLAPVVRFVGELLGGVPSIIIGVFVYAVVVRRAGFSGWAGALALAIMMVPIVAAADTLSVGAASRLFRIPLNDITTGFVSPFDVSPDGQRFLLNVPDAPSPLLYIRGFQRLLK